MKICKESIVLLLTMLLATSTLFSQVNPKWLRYPVISPNGEKIAFTYKGDIYTIPIEGGVAKAITSNPEHDFMPVWSKDGKTIAFASNRNGNFDVYVVSAEGGTPKRLTYHSEDEYPYSFSNDNAAVIFGAQRQDLASNRQFPAHSQPELYVVPVNGGRVSLLLTTPAESISMSSDSKSMLYQDKKGGENEWRKHHKSSMAKDIWLYNFETKKHSKLTNYVGEDRNPVFAPGDSIVYFLSEESGSFNVFRFPLKNPDSRTQITHFETNPVRFLSMSNSGLLCFGFDGEIYTMKQGEQPRKLAVEVRSDFQENPVKLFPVNGHVSEMSVSPDGKEVAYIARGEVFVSAAEGNFTKRITSTPEQERFVSFMPDGKSIVYASERNGHWQIFKTSKIRSEEPYFFVSTILKEEPVVSNENDNYQPVPSPDGKWLAFIENRTTLKVLNLETKETKTLMTSNELYYMSDGDQYFTWGPDSKWLLVEYSPEMSNSEVVILPIDGSRPFFNLTQSGYEDYQPKWVNKGKGMIWFSTRDGLRSYANSGTRQSDVYGMFFTRDAWDEFKLSKDEKDLQKLIEETAKKEKQKKEEKKSKKKKDEAKPDSSFKFDWDGITERTSRFTIHSASISDAVLSKDANKLYYLARFEDKYDLWSVDLSSKDIKKEMALGVNYGSFEWDGKMENLFLLADGKIYKLDLDKGKQESVEINTEMSVDTYAERCEMFNHVVLRTRQGFYSKKYHGIDWDAMSKHYAEFLPYIGNGFELTEMLSELLGELNSSHSGARYRGSSLDGDETASLGIFFDENYSGKGLKVVELLKEGPLDKANIDIAPGMIITKIDGVEIDANVDYAKYLNRKAGKLTLIEVQNPQTGGVKQFTVKPISLGKESQLLYKRWVKRNQDEVDRLSEGRLGYVHIPGMSDGPYRNAYGEIMGKFFGCDGVIVDTRFNGGGDLVSDLAMFFTGKKYIEYQTDKRVLGYEPTFRWTKPTVALVCEANYSDASCFACGYKQLGIGKLVGMPVPGTCSYSSWEMLLDDEILWGMVPISSKDMNGDWMENLQTTPDYVIENNPESVSSGKDLQLEKAVDVLMQQMVK